jgi:hypothetical protein
LLELFLPDREVAFFLDSDFLAFFEDRAFERLVGVGALGCARAGACPRMERGSGRLT